MSKRIVILLTVLALLISFSACKRNGENEKSSTENRQETETQTTSEPQTDAQQTEAPDTDSDSADIVFSESKASYIGTFYSRIYGNLKLYLQEGYFLLIDEYDDTKFTVFANNCSYSADSTSLPLFEDMNFDGHTDFGVCYADEGLNSYYYCFLWDADTKNFVYSNPLASLANPVFDSENSQIISNYKKSATAVREDIYIYNGDSLTLAVTRDIELAPETDTGPELISSELSIMENGNSALISVEAKKDAHSKWVCHIDNTDIVTLSSETFDDSEFVYEFLLSAVSQGTTTVIFRYETVDSGEYIEERIINITVDEGSNVKVIIPDEFYEEESSTVAEELTEE